METSLEIARSQSRYVEPASGVGFEDLANLIAHATEYGESLLGSAGRVRGIVETPMMPVHLAGKHRTHLVGIAAHGDDGLDRLMEELVQVLRLVAGNVDADFRHHLNGEWMNVTCGFRSGASDAKPPLRHGAQNALGKVATARVACAKNQDKGKQVVGAHDCKAGDASVCAVIANYRASRRAARQTPSWPCVKDWRHLESGAIEDFYERSTGEKIELYLGSFASRMSQTAGPRTDKFLAPPV